MPSETAPSLDRFTPGTRVRHYGQQYPEAQRTGTGAVAAVQPDPRPGFTEVLVYWDTPQLGGVVVSFVNIDRLFLADDPARFRFTQAELLAMARDRFGDEPRLWKFVCPNCGDVACAQDFIDAGVDPAKLGQECIGRQLGALTKPEPTNSRGCNWCAYGLFRGPWLIDLPQGNTVGSFRLAPAGGSDG